MSTATASIFESLAHRSRRLTALVVMLGLLGLAAPAGALEAAEFDDVTSSQVAGTHGENCKELSDSIGRLYSAYFLREPDDAGFLYWLDIYSGPRGGLPVMSQVFAESDEFRAMYGSLSNADFVNLVYRNVMDREPDAEGFNHWLGVLNGGYPRGSLMIAFSESLEYVQKTGTLYSLAGAGQWYDNRVQWECGYGSSFSFQPGNLPPTPYADVILWNHSTGDVSYQVGSGPYGAAPQNDVMAADSLVIYWNAELRDNNRVFFSTDGTPVYWSIAIYDERPGLERQPYTDGYTSLIRGN